MIPNSITGPADGAFAVESPEPYRQGSGSELWLIVREGRRFILKGLSEEVREHPEATARLRKEYSLGLRLNHPGIAGTYGFETHPAVGPVIVMEYVDGLTLHEYLQGDEKIPVKVRTDIALQIADALSYMHSLGISHRDLKPDNILVTRRNEAKIIDVGLGDSEDSVVFKQSLGTAEFGAPEQQSPEAADFRADVYSYGRLLEILLPESRFGKLRRSCMMDDPDSRIPMQEVAERLKSIAGKGRYGGSGLFTVLIGVVLILVGAGILFSVREKSSSDVSSGMEPPTEQSADQQDNAVNEEYPGEEHTAEPTTEKGEQGVAKKADEQRVAAAPQGEDKSARADYDEIFKRYLAEMEATIRNLGCGYDAEQGVYVQEVAMQRSGACADIASRMISELEAAGCSYAEMTRLGNLLNDNMVEMIEKEDGHKLY